MTLPESDKRMQGVTTDDGARHVANEVHIAKLQAEIEEMSLQLDQEKEK